MSKDHLSGKERETRKVTIILHGALTTILNNLEEKDYPHIFVSTNSNNHSSYNVRRTEINGDFSFDGFDDGHKKDLKHMKDLLTEEFVNVNFDYNKCLALLYEIYLRGVCYLHGLPTGQIYNLKSKITVKEKYDAPVVSVKEENTYSEYRKSFRSLK